MSARGKPWDLLAMIAMGVSAYAIYRGFYVESALHFIASILLMILAELKERADA